MNKLVLILALACAFGAQGAALADDVALRLKLTRTLGLVSDDRLKLTGTPGPGSDDRLKLTGTLGLVSDYRFRGLSQTFGEGFDPGPAIQGGIDYASTSGFYLGNWESSLSGVQYPNGSSLEMDFYGGYKHSTGDVTWDFGTIYYYYPGSEFTGLATAGGGTTDVTIKEWEVYAGASWKWLSGRYYYGLTDYFGLSEDVVVALCNPDVSCTPLTRGGDTEGTQYLTAIASYAVNPKLSLGASLGHTWVGNYERLDYVDYRLGLSYTLGGWALGAALIGSDADEQYWYAGPNGSGDVKDVGDLTLVLSLGKGF